MTPVAMLATWGDRYWPVFLLISSAWLVLGFGLPEFLALREGAHNPHLQIDNTLSWYARYELNVTSTGIHGIAWWVTFVLWMIFVVFITAHIWFDQFG